MNDESPPTIARSNGPGTTSLWLEAPATGPQGPVPECRADLSPGTFPVYRRLLDDGEISDRELSIIDAFVKVLPVSRIVSAGICLPSAHALFHEGVSSA